MTQHALNPSHLSAYMDGVLAESERRFVEKHLAECPACRGRLADYQRIGGLLRSAEAPQVPPRVDARVRALLRPREARDAGHGAPFSVLPRPLSMAALAAALVLSLVLLVGNPMEDRFGPAVASAYLYADEGEPAVKVEFTGPVDRDSVERSVEIEPAVPVKVAWQGDTMVVKPSRPLSPDANYTLKLKPRGSESRATPVALRFEGRAPTTPEALATPPAPPALVVAPPGESAATATPSRAAVASPSSPPTSTPAASGAAASPSPAASSPATASPVPGGSPSATPLATATQAARPSATATSTPSGGTPSPTAPAASPTPAPSPTATAAPSSYPTASTTPAPTRAAPPVGGTATPGATEVPTASTTPTAVGGFPTASPSSTATPTGTAPPAPSATAPATIATPAATPTPAETRTSSPAPESSPTASVSATAMTLPTPPVPLPVEPTPTALPTGTTTPLLPPTVVAHESTEGPVGAFGKVYRENPAVAIRLGAPRDGEFSVDLIRQGFEHGVMIRRGDTGEILVLRRDGAWFLYQDSWTVGEALGDLPERGGESLDGGKTPDRSFGKLWRQQAEVRRAMGMAIGDEQTSVGAMQRFAGGWMLSVDYRLIYVLYSDGNWRSFADTFTPPGSDARVRS